jgi:hypothetical protein
MREAAEAQKKALARRNSLIGYLSRTVPPRRQIVEAFAYNLQNEYFEWISDFLAHM